MTLVAYHLQPPRGGGFHFGREGLDLETSGETFASDSLFAAMVAALTEIEGAHATEAFLADWPTQDRPTVPPFRISSLFPMAGSLPLLPMPRIRVNLGDTVDQTSGKTLKKLAYVSPAILQRLMSDQPMQAWLPDRDGKDSRGLLLHNGQVWIAAEEQQFLPADWRSSGPDALRQTRLWKTDRVPHVTLDRQTTSSTIYHVGRTTYAEECGLWLLADIKRHQETLENLLEHLADRGIGGRRSSGNGAFKRSSIPAPDLPSAAQSKRYLTLSRYSPTRAEIEAGVLNESASYELVDIGGWLGTFQGTAQRRRRIRMIEAGSVLAAPATGQLVDVRPTYINPQGDLPHPVYRSGIALTIGLPDQGGRR